MSGEFYGQVLLNGLMLGGLYALVAVGLALYFGTLQLVNLAHGEFVMLGAFTAFAIWTGTGLRPTVALPLVLVGGSLFGILVYRLLIRRARSAGERVLILLTFGLSIFMIGGMRAVWGTTPRSVNLPGGRVGAFGLSLPTGRLVAFGLAMLFILAAYLVLQRTDFGRQIRAVSDNEGLAAASGIDVERVFERTFGVGIALAWCGGVLVGLVISANSMGGGVWTFKAFAIVAAGSLGSVPGALAAGLGLGVAEAFTGALVGIRMADLVAFLLLVVVLLLRPRESVL